VFLEKISLIDFKNYTDFHAQFCPAINCITGANGVGKTNLLDAIHYLCISKSAFQSSDTQNIKHQAALFVVNGTFVMPSYSAQVLCGVQLGQKKVLKFNQIPYTKITDHIGKFPTVLIAPQDQDLIVGGSEDRRRFFDSLISQIDHAYLLDLIQYNHLLKQRNSLLKQFYERNNVDRDWLLSYDNLIVPLCQNIFQKRKVFMEEFIPHFSSSYQFLTNNAEQTSLQYASDVADEDFEAKFANTLKRDVELQRTTLGIHKDDFLFEIASYPLKKIGSQGQQKSYLIALKLAQFAIIHHKTGIKPLLLLDDIFDKLDDTRIAKLMQMVARQDFGQIFLTDARPERSKAILGEIEGEKKFIAIAT
jgi:DNA replication and repair protein RecF